MSLVKSRKISDVVIERLALYLRTLEQVQDDHDGVISSKNLAEYLTVSAVQIRKDLSYFGDFGVQGQGYAIDGLIHTLRDILNAHHSWSAVLVGMGQLGRALVDSSHLIEQGFHIDAVFDIDRQKIGEEIRRMRILHVRYLNRSVEALDCRIGIIATPAEAAQRVADRMIQAGIQGILNYAPTALTVPHSVNVQNIDPVVNLRQLTYHIQGYTHRGYQQIAERHTAMLQPTSEYETYSTDELTMTLPHIPMPTMPVEADIFANEAMHWATN
ncbi:MAG: redox-sensing transcriptional repressor Rex [Chloroflexota bacterium]